MTNVWKCLYNDVGDSWKWIMVCFMVMVILHHDVFSSFCLILSDGKNSWFLFSICQVRREEKTNNSFERTFNQTASFLNPIRSN